MVNKMKSDTGYRRLLQSYADSVVQRFGSVSEERIEHHFECLEDWNKFHTLEDVKKWFSEKRKNCSMIVDEIPLNECNGWNVCQESGDISHVSGEFFSIHGVSVKIDSREVGEGGWNQPILTQIGYDGGLLGILRQRFDEVPHYLIEAKAEPGNYKKLQLSPTLQATFSNLKRAHEGRRPRFADIFENAETRGFKVIYDQWLSEDGGRLYLKRNKGMLVEVPEGTVSKIPEDFIWLSMWQIKELLKEDAWVNPHIRGIIANL